MLDLRHGTVVRTLIPKIAEGIFNVMCKFNEGTFARTQTVFVSCSLIPLVSWTQQKAHQLFERQHLDERVRPVLSQRQEDLASVPCRRRRNDRQLQGSFRSQVQIWYLKKCYEIWCSSQMSKNCFKNTPVVHRRARLTGTASCWAWWTEIWPCSPSLIRKSRTWSNTSRSSPPGTGNEAKLCDTAVKVSMKCDLTLVTFYFEFWHPDCLFLEIPRKTAIRTPPTPKEKGNEESGLKKI